MLSGLVPLISWPLFPTSFLLTLSLLPLPDFFFPPLVQFQASLFKTKFPRPQPSSVTFSLSRHGEQWQLVSFISWDLGSETRWSTSAGDSEASHGLGKLVHSPAPVIFSTSLDILCLCLCAALPFCGHSCGAASQPSCPSNNQSLPTLQLLRYLLVLSSQD